MKSKIETTTPQQAEIDWGKVMLVRGIYSGSIILTSGEVKKEGYFSGVVIVAGKTTVDAGCYADNWSKSAFTPLPLPQTITFYE